MLEQSPGRVRQPWRPVPRRSAGRSAIARVEVEVGMPPAQQFQQVLPQPGLVHLPVLPDRAATDSLSTTPDYRRRRTGRKAAEPRRSPTGSGRFRIGEWPECLCLERQPLGRHGWTRSRSYDRARVADEPTEADDDPTSGEISRQSAWPAISTNLLNDRLSCRAGTGGTPALPLLPRQLSALHPLVVARRPVPPRGHLHAARLAPRQRFRGRRARLALALLDRRRAPGSPGSGTSGRTSSPSPSRRPIGLGSAATSPSAVAGPSAARPFAPRTPRGPSTACHRSDSRAPGRDRGRTNSTS